eukprot:6207985-Pleurochrysis_carterae.AAC.3
MTSRLPPLLACTRSASRFAACASRRASTSPHSAAEHCCACATHGQILLTSAAFRSSATISSGKPAIGRE